MDDPTLDRIVRLGLMQEKGFQIIDAPTGNPISCDSCLGACCRDMRMDLTPKEKELLESGGTRFTQPLPEPDEPLPDEGYDVYKMEGACGWLQKNPEGNNFICGMYDIRPSVCKDFEVGSLACIAMRAMEGKNDSVGEKSE